MSALVFGDLATEGIAEWVLSRLPGLDGFGAPGSYSAIGWEVGGRLVAGVVYSDYRPGCWVVMTVASDGSGKWLSREFLHAAFQYPFEQLNTPRINAFVDAENTAALRFDLHLGFTLEGRLRQAAAEKRDLLLFGMLKEECRWLQPVRKERKKK